MLQDRFMVFSLSLFVLLGLCAVQAQELPQQARVIPADATYGVTPPAAKKSVIDLNGRWQFREGDESVWTEVTLPASWKGRRRGVFSREFVVPSELPAASVFQLVAQSISYYCEISINGQFVGKHAGLTSFGFKVSPGIIRAGTNSIEILVHNELNPHETLPRYEQLWDRTNYGGIVHDIAIIAHSGVWVQETYVSTSSTGEGRPGTISYKAILNSGVIFGVPGDTTLAVDFGKAVLTHIVEVIDPVSKQVLSSSEAKRIVVESDRLTEVQLELTLPSVRVWSPDRPNLYVLRQRTLHGVKVLDETKTQIGFRRLDARKEGVFLNNERIFIKALSYMEDSPRNGRSMSVGEMERDVLLMKNLGANAVRLVAGSVHPHFLSLCDRYGLLVFLDIPMGLTPTGLLSKAGARTSARNMIREMLARDYSRPSLVGIGVAQYVGTEHDGDMEEWIADLVPLIKQYGPMLAYATFQNHIPEKLPDLLDVAGIDVAPESFSKISKLLTTIDQHAFDKPIMISSLSYPVQVGNYSGYSDPRSVDAQAQFYLDMYTVIQEQRYAGLVVHSFADWGVTKPIMAIDRVHEFTATSGVVDHYRQKRMAYDILKACFNNEKPPILTTGTHEEEHPASFVVFGIFVIFVFATVYNLFRRFRENVVRSFLRPYNFFSDVRDQRMLSIFQTSMVGVIGSLSAALVFANLLYHARTNVLVDHVIAQFVHETAVKKWMNYAAWNPLENILVTTGAFFVVLLLLTVLIRVAAFLFRKKVALFDAYSVTMWSVLPIGILAPFGMILYRVLGNTIVEILVIMTYIGFHVWIISRFFKGTAVVFDVRPVFFYLGGYAVLLSGLFFWLLFLNNSYEIFAYLRYFAELWLSMRGLVV